MTAKLSDLNNPDNIIIRNVRFFYPVKTTQEEAFTPLQFEVEQIVGEKYEDKTTGEPTHYLLTYKGFDESKPEWTSSENLSCDELLEEWKKLPKEVRKAKTLEAMDRLAKSMETEELDFKSTKKQSEKKSILKKTITQQSDPARKSSRNRKPNVKFNI